MLGALVAIAAAGCPATEGGLVPVPPVSAGKVRVRVFTEPAPTRMMVTAGRFLFVATDAGVERWGVDGGVLPLTSEHGLGGGKVLALAADAERRWAWIVTDGGLGYYNAGSEIYSGLPAPGPGLGIDLATAARDGGVSLAPAADGGAWLGTAKGLFYVSAQGGWASTPIKDPVRTLARDRAGWLWIGTRGGLIARKPSGETVRVGPAEGCVIADPRLMLEGPEGGVVVIGADAAGHERIALGKQLAWASFRTLPELKWEAAVRRGTGVVVLGGGRVYRLGSVDVAAPARPLARDGVRLVPVAGQSAIEWVIDPLDVAVPPDPVALGAADDQLLIGTRDQGTARFRDGEPHPHDWFRRKQMFRDATTLSVACGRADDCWIAMGARTAWHWIGDRFLPGQPEQVVLAVVRDPAGAIYALHRAPAEAVIRLSRVDGATWTPVAKVELATPGTEPEVSFARFAAGGALWVGLRYHDGLERRPFGVAVVDLAAAKVAYHRTGADRGKDKDRMMPVPVGVVDGDVRGDVAWFATNEGIARLAGGKVQLWTEADGLRSELARGITIGPDGAVTVATGAGAGIWDGKAWDFPAALRFDINDVVATRGGQLWMATDRGVAAYDGKKVRRIDLRRGLAENEIAEIVVDQFDRVWARGAGSLTMISQ
jgi:hypothetical protein